MAVETLKKDNILVYFAHPSGELMLAPDSHVTPEQCGMRGWRRCEAVGAKEIERISSILSRQLYEKRMNLTAEQHLRSMQFRERIKSSCKLRIAQKYSDNDVQKNKEMLARMEHYDELMLGMIAREFDETSRTSMLEMERQEASIAKGPQKHEGIL